jgi:hypothetical protein
MADQVMTDMNKPVEEGRKLQAQHFAPTQAASQLEPKDKKS